jgi:trehalose 6-phosphate synthase
MTSAFWGQSFVAELTRISAQGEKKLKARRASLARPSTQGSMPQTTAPEQMDKASKPAEADEVEGEHADILPEQADPVVRSQTN